MKLLSIFLLLAFSSQLNAQRSDFVEYLLELQFVTDPLYDYMLNHFNLARGQLSRLLTDLNDDTVIAITDGLRSVIATRDRVLELAEVVGTTGDMQCINATMATFNEELEAVGAEISRCAGENLERLNTDVTRVHSFLLENNALKFEVQNMVLSVFRDVSFVFQ